MSDITIGHPADFGRSVVRGYEYIKVPIEGLRWIAYTSVAVPRMTSELTVDGSGDILSCRTESLN